MKKACADCCCKKLATKYDHLEANARKQKRKIRRLKSKNLEIAILYNQAIDLLEKRQQVIDEVIKTLDDSSDSDEKPCS